MPAAGGHSEGHDDREKGREGPWVLTMTSPSHLRSLCCSGFSLSSVLISSGLLTQKALLRSVGSAFSFHPHPQLKLPAPLACSPQTFHVHHALTKNDILSKAQPEHANPLPTHLPGSPPRQSSFPPEPWYNLVMPISPTSPVPIPQVSALGSLPPPSPRGGRGCIVTSTPWLCQPLALFFFSLSKIPHPSGPFGPTSFRKPGLHT